jgi:hypothetical protein
MFVLFGFLKAISARHLQKQHNISDIWDAF